jgi:RNA polymerase sigma factor (TIGR02999 family)
MRTTALVNEAFLRLAGPSAPSFDYRGQFFAFAARVMRNVLVDYVREGQASKRGGGVANVTLDEALQVVKESKLDLMMLDEALIRLEEMDVRLSRLVELRFFAGLDIKGVAAELGISVSTATRDWRTARVWLQRELA